jgi:hypothetical protein
VRRVFFMSRPAPAEQRVSCIQVSREWTRIVVKGPGPGGRFWHTMTLVGSKLFVFGGTPARYKEYFNDIWSFDLNCCAFALASALLYPIITKFFNSKIESFLGVI